MVLCHNLSEAIYHHPIASVYSTKDVLQLSQENIYTVVLLFVGFCSIYVSISILYTCKVLIVSFVKDELIMVSSNRSSRGIRNETSGWHSTSFILGNYYYSHCKSPHFYIGNWAVPLKLFTLSAIYQTWSWQKHFFDLFRFIFSLNVHFEFCLFIRIWFCLLICGLFIFVKMLLLFHFSPPLNLY